MTRGRPKGGGPSRRRRAIAQALDAQASAGQPRRRGRPRTRPLPDPNAPKRRPGGQPRYGEPMRRVTIYLPEPLAAWLDGHPGQLADAARAVLADAWARSQAEAAAAALATMSMGETDG